MNRLSRTDTTLSINAVSSFENFVAIALQQVVSLSLVNMLCCGLLLVTVLLVLLGCVEVAKSLMVAGVLFYKTKDNRCLTSATPLDTSSASKSRDCLTFCFANAQCASAQVTFFLNKIRLNFPKNPNESFPTELFAYSNNVHQLFLVTTVTLSNGDQK